MEKIKEIIEKYKSKNISDKKRVENLVFFLLMIIIIVIGMNTIFFSDNKDDKNKQDVSNEKIENEQTNKDDNIEERLEKILSKVQGVSNVSVMVTYESEKEVVPIYNLSEKETLTKETDSAGGIRDTTEKDYSKQVVFEENGNNSTIVIEKEVKPKIAGIIVVANYNNDVMLKQNIISAVATLANISEYKVQVLASI